MVSLLRHLELLQAVSALPANPPTAPDLDKIRGRGLQLPDLGAMKSIFANATSSVPADDTRSQREQANKETQNAIQEFHTTKQTIDELTGLNSQQLQINVYNDRSLPSPNNPNPTARATVQIPDVPRQGLGLNQKGLDKLSQSAKEFLGSKAIDPSKDTLPGNRI